MIEDLESLARLADKQSLVIGSGAGSTLVFPHPGVAPQHALLLRRGAALLVQDLDTVTGTFVNGREVRGLVELLPGDRLRLGTLELRIPQPQPAAPVGGATAVPPEMRGPSSALAVSFVEVDRTFKDRSKPGGTARALDAVSLDFEPGQFVGILGASGSGKSTLIKVLAGVVESSSGTILLDRREVDAPDLRRDSRIAYLPQDVIIHEALTPTVALEAIARLKGVGATDEDRRNLVADALGRVGLEEHADKPIHRLSGGQRKRTALAAELLGDPKLILLDEATSGLDPATEADMMVLFHSLAGEGRTVVCITHFTSRVHLCDRLLFLMDGKCIFDGHADDLKRFFRVEAVEAAYSTTQAGVRPEEWAARFQEFQPGRPAATRPADPSRVVPPPHVPAPMTPDRWIRQAGVLIKRYARLQWADLKNLLLLFAQAPAIALMLAVTFGSIKHENADASLEAADTKQVIFVLVLAVLWCSSTTGVREVVKELPILRHEMRFGIGLGPYVLSKFVLLGLFSLVQALVLLELVKGLTELSGPGGLQYLVVGCTSLVGVALGLLVSASSGTSERAMTILPVLLIAQAIFSGGLAHLTGLVEKFAMVFVPAFWAMEGLKATLSGLQHERYVGGGRKNPPPILGEGTSLWWDIPMLLVHLAVLLAVTYWALRIQVQLAAPLRSFLPSRRARSAARRKDHART